MNLHRISSNIWRGVKTGKEIRFSVVRNLSKKSELKFDLPSPAKLEAEVEKVGGKRTVKWYQWFATPRGQKAVGLSFIVASAGAVLVGSVPHTHLLKYTKSFYQHYTGGLVTKVSQEMLELLGEVVSDMNLTEEEKQRIKFFVQSPQEVFSWGDLSSGALIGYPLYFHYNSPMDVPLDRMYFGIQDSANPGLLSRNQLESREAAMFSASMLLSRDAKKFAVAREIERLRAEPNFLGGAVAAAFILLTLFTSRIINKQLNLFRRPPVLRGIAYGSILPSMCLFFLLTRDGQTRVYQGLSDRRAAEVSAAYARGGAEYYSKIMARNISLRSLQSGGEKLYTLHGDLIPGIIRMKNKPLAERRDICQQALGAEA